MLVKFPAPILEKAARVKLAIFDVDGVLADGHIYLDDHGVGLKAFHVHDGIGIKMLQKSGVQIAIISSGDAPNVAKRMSNLGVADVFQGQENKQQAYNELLNKYHLSNDQVSYMGDDLPDIALIQRAGFGISVPNAVPIVREYADWVTQFAGGHGAVREVCELIMHAQNTFETVLQSYLS